MHSIENTPEDEAASLSLRPNSTKSRRWGKWLAATAGAVVFLVVIVLSPDWRILPPSFSRFDREVLYYRDRWKGPCPLVGIATPACAANTPT